MQENKVEKKGRPAQDVQGESEKAFDATLYAGKRTREEIAIEVRNLYRAVNALAILIGDVLHSTADNNW